MYILCLLSPQLPKLLQEVLIELHSKCMEKGVTGKEMLEVTMHDNLQTFRGDLNKSNAVHPITARSTDSTSPLIVFILVALIQALG